MRICKCGFTTQNSDFKFCPKCSGLLQTQPVSDTNERIYNAQDVARYVINFANARGGLITNLKLQKILYYIQAAFLVEKGYPCFYNNIVNWQHGPVIPDVYYNFVSFGNKPIPELNTVDKLIYKNGRFAFECITLHESNIHPNDVNLINNVIVGMLPYNEWALAAKTMEEEPWAELGTNYNSVMLTNRIKDYFTLLSNKKRMFGDFELPKPKRTIPVRAVWEFDADVTDFDPSQINVKELAKDLAARELQSLLSTQYLSAEDFHFE